jgi:sec-independent protein translocase protein TatA
MLSVLLAPATVFGLGTGELVVILIIILVLFGGSSLPKLTRSLGKSVKEFKKAVSEEDSGEPAPDDGKKKE